MSALGVAALLACPHVADARTWRVTPDGTGDAPTIQAAIDSTGPGDVVLLAPGTYSWSDQVEETSAQASMVQLAPGITLRGETGSASTILDGESRGRVMLGTDIGNQVTIEDLTVQNGKAPLERIPGKSAGLAGPYDSHGGGIDLRGDATPTIRRCLFRGNQAQGGTASGGAVSCGSATIEDCEFVGNEAGISGPTNGFGGAIRCKAAVIRRCTFRDNRVWGYDAARGGAVHSENATLVECLFEGNSAMCPGAPRGGAVIDGGAVRIERCMFRGNSVDAHYFSSTGGAADAGSGTVVDCVFIDNVATCAQASGHGGALAGNDLTVRGCSFIRNEAKRTNPLGPGIGGALYLRFPSTVEGCTLIGNAGGTPDGVGGIRFEESGDVRSTIIAFTTIGATCSGNVTWSCCDLFENAGGNAPCGTDAGGNFSLDPLFCASDPALTGDVSIRADSICRDRGEASRCGQIGAGAVGCETSAVERRTWSAVKRIYR